MPGRRHHYAETWDRVSETWVIYIDGVQLSTGSTGTKTFINDSPYLHISMHCYPEKLQDFAFTACNPNFGFSGSTLAPWPRSSARGEAGSS